MMRLIIDTLIALMLVAVLAGVLLHYRREQRESLRHQQVHHALARLQEQMLYRSALGEAETSPGGFAVEISPRWFSEGVPINGLLPSHHPWLDIAPADDASDHPPDPVVTRPGQAGLWYNPARGVFRARVAPQFTDQATLDLYNHLNGTALPALPGSMSDRSRAPRPAPAPGREALAQAEVAPPPAPSLRGGR